MGVLYAEGARRYIEALSTYTRRRMAQAARADGGRIVAAGTPDGAVGEPESVTGRYLRGHLGGD